MGKGRSKMLGWTALALLLSALFLVWWTGREKGPAMVRLPADAEAVDQVLIRDAYDSLQLKLEGDQWMIQEASISVEASARAVENLLFAARHLQVDAVLSQLPDEANPLPRSIQFFTKGKRVRSYLLWFHGNQSYLQLPEEKGYCSISLPGYPGLKLEEVFSMRRAHYLERMIVHLQPSEIEWIEVDRRDEPAFRIHMDADGTFSCRLPESDSLLPEGALDDLSLRLLFSYFTAIRYSSTAGEFEGVLPERNDASLVASLRMKTTTGKHHSLEVHALPVDSLSDRHLFEACVYHNDRPEALIINYLYLDVLMRPLHHYFGDKL